MVQTENYTGHTIWISKLVEDIGSRLSLSTVPAALLTIGLIPYGLTVAFFVVADGQPDPSFVLYHSLAAVIPFLGPALIWHYDENIFPTFLTEVQDVVEDTGALVETVERYERFFAERYWLVMIPWTLFLLGVVIANVGFFTEHGVTGVFDVAFVIYLGFVLWVGILSGIGVHGAVTTISCVRAVGNLDLTIDPLHHDGLGGLSTIGYVSIRTTLLISVGSFGLPLAFAIAAGGGYETLVYLAVACYVGCILASFVYPTVYVNRRAQAVREAVLREKRARIRDLKAQMSADAVGELSELETQLKIQTLREEFTQYRSVNLYPLSISIITRLASSVLLPIAFTLLETYVFTG